MSPGRSSATFAVLVPMEPVVAGDYMSVSIGGIGNASVRFV